MKGSAHTACVLQSSVPTHKMKVLCDRGLYVSGTDMLQVTRWRLYIVLDPMSMCAT